MVTLDDIVSDRAPHLIKIDTDGYDNRILRGSAQCLKNKGPHLFFEYSPYHIRRHGGEEPTAIFKFLRELQYSPMIVYDGSGYPICLVDLDSRTPPTIVQYADLKPMFYFDLLVSKNSDLLGRFYQLDQKRFPDPRNGCGEQTRGSFEGNRVSARSNSLSPHWEFSH